MNDSKRILPYQYSYVNMMLTQPYGGYLFPVVCLKICINGCQRDLYSSLPCLFTVTAIKYPHYIVVFCFVTVTFSVLTVLKWFVFHTSLHWRHNGHDGVSNHQPRDCLLNRLFRRRSKKVSKLRVTGLCEGNSPVTGEFPAQRASNAENVTIWWRHHILRLPNDTIVR